MANDAWIITVGEGVGKFFGGQGIRDGEKGMGLTKVRGRYWEPERGLPKVQRRFGAAGKPSPKARGRHWRPARSLTKVQE